MTVATRVPAGAVDVAVGLLDGRTSSPPWARSRFLRTGAARVTLGSGEGASGMEMTFPRCRKCNAGELVPLSDFGSQGASIQYKAWICTNPSCLYNVKIRNGDIIINEPVSDASLHPYRTAR